MPRVAQIGASALVFFWPDTLTRMWDQFLEWNLVLQLIVGGRMLPWVVATWVWQSDWSTLARRLVIRFLAVGTLISFAPRSRKPGAGAS